MTEPSPLRQRMREQMCLRNLAQNTKDSYEIHVACMARHFGASPDRLTPEQVRGYLLHQEVDRKQAPSTVPRHAVVREGVGDGAAVDCGV